MGHVLKISLSEAVPVCSSRDQDLLLDTVPHSCTQSHFKCKTTCRLSSVHGIMRQLQLQALAWICTKYMVYWAVSWMLGAVFVRSRQSLLIVTAINPAVPVCLAGCCIFCSPDTAEALSSSFCTGVLSIVQEANGLMRSLCFPPTLPAPYWAFLYCTKTNPQSIGYYCQIHLAWEKSDVERSTGQRNDLSLSACALRMG